MKILAIDTSTEACSVALDVDGNIAEQFEVARQRHTELVLPMVEQLLAEADLRLTDLDALAFGRGPGSFTGIRIGTGVVQGLSLGSGLSVAPVSTLAAIAQGMYRRHQSQHVLAAIDARMQGVYFGTFGLDDQGYMQPLQAEQLLSPAEIELPDSQHSWHGAGTAWSAYADSLAPVMLRLGLVHADCLPHAQDIAVLARLLVSAGQLIDATAVEPVYLRNEVAWKKIDQQ